MSAAHAFLLPVRQVEGGWFVYPLEEVQPVLLDVRVRPSWENPDDDGRMDVDVEARLRNRRESPRTLRLFVAADGTRVHWRDASLAGESLSTQPVTLRHDPAHPTHVSRPGHLLEFEVPARDIVVLRVRLRVSLSDDSIGQHFLELPMDAFALWQDAIENAVIDLSLGERALGLQTSLSHAIVYPEGRLRWFVREWRPQRVLRVGWVGAWQALVLAAEVEECPRPWDVVRRLSEGVSSVETWLQGWDRSALNFCGSLPLVVRGHVFSSERVRRELADIPMQRYLGTSSDRGSFYIPDPGFRMDDLTEMERVYHRVLTNVAERGRAQP